MPEVGPWAEKKYRLIDYYNQLFTTGTKNKFEHRVYIDLFAGAGKAKIQGTSKIVFTSSLLAMKIPDPYTEYLFCEQNGDQLNALRNRTDTLFPGQTCEFFHGDCNVKIDGIISKIPRPSHSNRVLSFCFVDPYNLGLHFSTIEKLSEFRTDFLILLATDMDGARNVREYAKEDNPRINLFLGDSSWRSSWKKQETQGRGFSIFLLNAFTDRMIGMGYLAESRTKMVHIRSDDRNLPLYRLALYSKDGLAYRFWNDVRKYVLQPELEL